MKVKRNENNPIIKPEDILPSRNDFEVICAFNAGVVKIKNEIILLLRIAERPISMNSDVYLSPYFDLDDSMVKVLEFDKNNSKYDFSDSRLIRTDEELYLTSISHLRVARSIDGVNFTIDKNPFISASNIYEMYGVEDPRITCIDDTYFINYSAISPVGITTCLASTKDFISNEKLGIIFLPDNKDVELFPEKINGKYYAMNRPSSGFFGKNEMWVSESPDLKYWGNHKYLMGSRKGYWDSGRIGSSAGPFKLTEGWLEIYHGATKDHKYCLGAVLLDLEKPWKVLARSEMPIMSPEAEYETTGFFGNVIFTCGAIIEDGVCKIYYGAADEFTAYAEISLGDIMSSLVYN